MKLQIINGPNLNLLGTREKNIYGDQNFDSYVVDLKEKYKDLELSFFQSNIEGGPLGLFDRNRVKCKSA